MREDVDPRIDKMIAFLYGELPPAEEAAFRRLLDADATLRTEFQELTSARGLLAEWKVEETVPSFVLVENAAERKAPAAESRPGGEGPVRRFFASLRGFAATPGWAFATAAVALVVLGFSGFRVERVQGGVAFRLGGSRPAAPAERQLPGVGPGLPIEPGTRPAGSSGSDVVPVGSYLTQEEFNSYNSQLMATLAELLNQYDQRRDREVTDLVQGLYRRVNDQQMFDYERTNRRIDALGDQLQLGSSRGTSVEDLLKGAERQSKPPSPAPRTGEE